MPDKKAETALALTMRALRDRNAANKAFEKHYKKAFPVGSTVRYRRRERPIEVEVVAHLDHGTDSRFTVQNPDSGRVYQLSVWEVLYFEFGNKVFAT